MKRQSDERYNRLLIKITLYHHRHLFIRLYFLFNFISLGVKNKPNSIRLQNNLNQCPLVKPRNFIRATHNDIPISVKIHCRIRTPLGGDLSPGPPASASEELDQGGEVLHALTIHH